MHDFVSLEIVGVARETADVTIVGFAVPEAHRDAFQFKPGQHMAVRHSLLGEEIRRTYSICSGPDDLQLSVAIKRIPGGAFSTWAYETLQPGMRLDVMPPAGRFVLPDAPGEHAHVLAIAAGIGITPIMAMAEHVMRRQPGVRFTLIYGNRDLESIVFRQRLEDLKDAYVDRLTLVHVLSRNDESDTPLLEGRISAEKIAAFASHLFRIEDVDQAFVCGPGTLIRDVRGSLLELGLPRERVHHEFFAAGGGAFRAPAAQPLPGPAPNVGAEGAEIVAVLDGVRHRFQGRPGEPVIEAALRAGVRVPYSCKGGMCSTCRAKVVEGRAQMRVNYSLEPWEVEKGFVLTCQATADSERLVIDYDQM